MKWTDLADIRWKDLKRMDRSDMLHALGLEEHTPTSDFFGGLGLFAVGLLVGAGLGLMFAPKRGSEMRSQLSDTLRRKTDEIEQSLPMESVQAPGSQIS